MYFLNQFDIAYPDKKEAIQHNLIENKRMPKIIHKYSETSK